MLRKLLRMVEILIYFKIRLQIIILKLLLVLVLCTLVAKGFVMLAVERLVSLIKGICNG
jgi:hypothetical protein